MKSGPVTITNAVSTPAKRTLFRIALTVVMVGIVAVGTILLVQSALALARLRYFVDIGLHPLHITSVILLVFGLFSVLTLIIFITALIKLNKTLASIAAGMLGVCSLGLVAFSIWSFLTISSGHLPASINDTLVKELDQTQYTVGSGNNIIVENTNKMARLEKQHNCCGLTDPIDDYRSRQPAAFGSLQPSSSGSGGGGGSSSSRGGKSTSTQRHTGTIGSAVQLPISCCDEKYRSADNLCVDMFGNSSNNPLSRYNTQGCYTIVARNKFERIQRQGFTTIVAACLSVISCIALAAVVRLLTEGYQIVPLRTTT